MSRGSLCAPTEVRLLTIRQPRRILCLHMENTTTTPPEFHLHVASVDGTPFGDLVVEATKGLTAANSAPKPLTADDLSSEWDIIFPVSQFLTVRGASPSPDRSKALLTLHPPCATRFSPTQSCSIIFLRYLATVRQTYKVPLPPTPATYASPFADTFTVTASHSVLNSIKRTRSFDIIMDHPGLIWPVVAFDADVVSWGTWSLSFLGSPARADRPTSVLPQTFLNRPSVASFATTSSPSRATA